MAVSATLVSAAEYLRLEREAKTKHEWYGGQIYEMPGVGKERGRIQMSLYFLVERILRNSNCEFFSSDIRVRAGEFYTYPHGSLVCDARFEEAELDVLLNPVALFEVLSPSTEGYDRGEKFRRYSTIETLQEYVLISTERPRVEVFTRVVNGWLLRSYDGLDAVASLQSVPLELPLDALYQRVFLPS
ncbi:Uma2 family endonuclease [bacterium]|nr:MAG: Uma2 family endonuclease [bacterium]